MGNSEQFGDIYATINVRLPESLSDEERQLYRQLRDIRSVVTGDRFAGANESNADNVEGDNFT